MNGKKEGQLISSEGQAFTRKDLVWPWAFFVDFLSSSACYHFLWEIMNGDCGKNLGNGMSLKYINPKGTKTS